VAPDAKAVLVKMADALSLSQAQTLELLLLALPLEASGLPVFLRPSRTGESAASAEFSPQIPAALMAGIADGIERFGPDAEPIARALDECLARLRAEPVKHTLDIDQTGWLVDSGVISASERADLHRGAQISNGLRSAVRGAVASLHASMSLQEVASFLEQTDEAVRAAEAAAELFAVEVAGQLRFPLWQFDRRECDGRLRGLTETIRMLTDLTFWPRVDVFMQTPNDLLLDYGPRSPVEWLRAGGDIRVLADAVQGQSW